MNIFPDEGDREDFIQLAAVAALIGMCASARNSERDDLKRTARDCRDLAVQLADELEVLPEPDKFQY